MISQAEKEKIIEKLGRYYVGPLLQYLLKNNILNSKGRPFRASRVTKLVGGFEEDIQDEVTIIKAAKAVSEELKAIKVERKEIAA